MALASPSAITVSNSTMLLRILTTWPQPTGPQRVTSLPNVPINGSRRSNTSGSAPTITDSCPASAAARVRATGASTNTAPRCAKSAASVRVVSTGEVPRSTTAWPACVQASRPS